MNRNRNNVVLSRRAVLEEERKEVRQQIIDELNVGDIVTGTISNIVDFGAFVDLDGIDGLIHISELSWTHINHPSEVLQVNQEVKVKVLDIDRERQRISLGLKQTQEDPWQKIVAEHRVGDVVQGRVTKIVAFGAFVEIYEGIEGLVHISELANRHVERPDEVVSVGQQVLVKIIEIDSDRRRLSLSIKRVEGQQVEPMRIQPEPEPAGVADGEAEAEAAEETEPVAVVEVEQSADEPAEAAEVAADEPAAAEVAADEPALAEAAADEPALAEAAADEPAVIENEPELGLSDDVFPAGAESREAGAGDDEPADAPADEA
jgi:small subunit ribosomal protein S1